MEYFKEAEIEDEYTVQLNFYNNDKLTNRKTTLKGSLFEIFDKFTGMNDRLKYCNGSYYSFIDNKIEKLYQEFIKNYKGNFFLDNAIRRGCLID